jgi:hypothetical protein
VPGGGSFPRAVRMARTIVEAGSPVNRGVGRRQTRNRGLSRRREAEVVVSGAPCYGVPGLAPTPPLQPRAEPGARQSPAPSSAIEWAVRAQAAKHR